MMKQKCGEPDKVYIENQVRLNPTNFNLFVNVLRLKEEYYSDALRVLQVPESAWKEFTWFLAQGLVYNILLLSLLYLFCQILLFIPALTYVLIEALSMIMELCKYMYTKLHFQTVAAGAND